MAYAVETFDYEALVERMSEAGMGKMAEVLNEALATLPPPRLQTERTYFWRALANAARDTDAVWLWLCAHFPHLDPSGGMHTSGRFVPEWELPQIRETDPVAQPVELPEQMPAEPTEENFEAQARRLQQIFDERNGRIKSVAEYVATFCDSGSAGIHAQFQLGREGLMALATSEGVEWLRKKYAP